MRSRFFAALLGSRNSLTGLSATGDVKDYSIHQHGMSVRAMGMGGSFHGCRR